MGPHLGGDERDRTDDPLLAKQVLSQLSYTPIRGVIHFYKWSLKIKQHQTKSINYYRPIRSASILYLLLLRKEVIQPHLPIRLPCYDFTPITNFTFDSCLLAVSSLASGATGSHGVTGGVYKTRERIHRGMLIRDY